MNIPKPSEIPAANTTRKKKEFRLQPHLTDRPLRGNHGLRKLRKDLKEEK